VSGAGPARGELAILLHTHMPYVAGYGTWPFGEEWLFEAMADCYLPLLDVLEEAAPLTLSLTPVLCDQLALPDVADRFRRFILDVRRNTHAIDAAGLRAGGEPGLAQEVERAGAEYERALERFDAVDGDLLAALAHHASWTSAATHAVLPLCATDGAVRMQVEAGIAAHRARVGAWGGGFWLPECAYAPWLDETLAAAGVRACCVDLTDRFGQGDPAHLQPLRGHGGPTLVPIDRRTIELVWSDAGYPADARYRDYHHHTIHHHRPWSNDGTPYDHEEALAVAAADAADFVARTRERLAAGGLAVLAIDTELLGHWWYEGIHWLRCVVSEAGAQGLPLARLDDALTRHPPREIDTAELGISSWGTPRDLSTWDGPAVAELAFGARAAELGIVSRGASLRHEAVRELAALQSSDWAFMTTRDLASDYPADRVAGHRQALEEALDGSPIAHNIAPFASASQILAP
jgi:1,4-alpha-glucan branching enzyme